MPKTLSVILTSALLLTTSPATYAQTQTQDQQQPQTQPQAQPQAQAEATTTQPDITEIKIPAGTKIEVESAHTVSSKDVKEGDALTFTTILPLIIDGKTVIEKGAIVTARVMKAKKGGSWGRAGQLAYSMQDVVAVDNSRIPLEFAQAGKGDSKGGTVATGAIVTGLVFLPAAPLWGFKKGKNAVIPQGKRLEVMIHADVTVKVPAGK